MFNNTPLLYLTQSLWRDEAFSVLIAAPGGMETVRITAADYTPPLYYLILHYWMIIFGRSEIVIRSLSFVFFLLFLYVFYRFSKAIFKSNWANISLLLAAVNPMLIYYGFEARAYSLYALTTTASMYFFYINKSLPYVITTTLALYTHPYTIVVPITQAFYLLIKKKLNKQKIFLLAIPFILYIPWMFILKEQVTRTEQMWMWPINSTLIQSVLGNMLIGYEGTPGHLWNYMKALSLILASLYIFAISSKKRFEKNSLFFLWVFLPLVLILTVSYFKPVFVNRYLITVSVAQVMLLSIALQTIPKTLIRIGLTVFFLGLFVYTLYYLPPYIKKVDIRKAFNEINAISTPDDIIYANTPLVFFESVYYYQNPQQVYLFNLNHINLPNYLGAILIPQEVHRDSIPEYPRRVFMVYEDGHYEIFSGFPNTIK